MGARPGYRARRDVGQNMWVQWELECHGLDIEVLTAANAPLRTQHRVATNMAAMVRSLEFGLNGKVKLRLG